MNEDYYNRMVEAAHFRMDKIERRIKHRYQAPTVPQYDLQAPSAYTGPVFATTGVDTGTGNTTRVCTSPDGANWTAQTDPSESGSDTGFGICFGNGKWVAVCGLNILSSSDGITWTSVTSPFANPGAQATDGYGNDVVWADALGLFVAVGNAPEGDAVATSPDGVTWTSHATNVGFGQGIGWNGSELVVIGEDTTLTYSTLISSDGVTWTAHANPHFDNAQRFGANVIWVPSLSKWFACGTGNINGPSGNPYNVISSSDGITWAGAFDDASFEGDLAYSPSLGLLVWGSGSSTSHRIFTSPDGVTWTHQASADGFTGIRGLSWSESLGLFVAVYGTNGLSTSPDGVTWTSVSGFSAGNFTKNDVAAAS